MIVASMLAALIVGFQGSSQDADPWKTIISKDGQFVVQLPTDPTSSETRTANGPGGRIKVTTVLCETPTVVYMARRVVLPAKIANGAETIVLNSFRDYFVTELKGKVISEKKVRFEGGNPGLDFTIRAQPKPKVIATVRAREYLSGQSIYALFAVSGANLELPDDIGRFFGSFTIGTKPRVKSAPKPEAAGKELAGWGTLIDPDGDCRVSPDGKALSVTVPGTLHDLNADIDKYNAPRVLRAVDGDFEIQVKVVGDFKPGEKALRAKTYPYNGAGLFVWRDSDNFIRLERGAIFNKGKIGTFATFEEREGGSTGALHNGGLTPGTSYLKLARRGSRIFGFTSKDGKKWTALKPIDTVWPSDLKVGLDAINSSNQPFVVKFEEFKLNGKAASAD
jgi:regulation of enolase protein 1 (concanavalin A-like superfamily)